MTRTYRIAIGVYVWALAWVCSGASALAQDGERVGENIGDLLSGWARHLYMGVAALIALMFLLNRRFADLAVFMLAALIVGGFVFAANDVAGIAKDIWNTVAA